MIKVGLTGGIGSGKSLVADLFAALGIQIIYADKIGKEIIDNDIEVIRKISDHFGADILINKKLNAGVDKNKLRGIIFSNTQEKLWLEQLLHPLIRQEILSSIEKINSNPNPNPNPNSNVAYCIVEAAILIEADFKSVVDKIIVVDCPENQQITRVAARNKLSESEVKSIMQAQLSRKARLEHADIVIVNNGSLEDLKPQISAIHKSFI